MSDLAEKSANAIIRPGMNFRWRMVAFWPRDYKALSEAAVSPHTFGTEAVLVTSDSASCCGALFVSDGGGIQPLQFWRLEYFFSRDGKEARVFEYDKWSKHFHARRLEELWQRRL